MNRSRFVRLAALAFGLVVASFLSRGLTRLVADSGTAVLVSAPLLLAGGILAAYLAVRGGLDLLGIVPIGE